MLCFRRAAWAAARRRWARSLRLKRCWTAVQVALLLALLLGAVQALLSVYPWQWYRIPPLLFRRGESGWLPGLLTQGLGLTLALAAAALPLTLLIALATTLARISSLPSLRALAVCYVALIRNTPLLVQLSFAYFVLSPVLGLSGFAAGVLALALFEGAYLAEVLRAAIIALPRNQWRAARALGLSEPALLQTVIVPQALLQATPMLISQLVSLVKDSALVSVIGVYELTRRAREAIDETFLSFEIWTITAAIYLLLNLLNAFGGQLLERWLQRRFSTGHREG